MDGWESRGRERIGGRARWIGESGQGEKRGMGRMDGGLA